MTASSVKRWVTAVLLVATGLFGLWGLNRASAGKPGGGVTHTSTIYFAYQNSLRQMYEDGSGKSQALPAGVFGFPSSQVYGGSRWYLTLADALGDGHGEIFAFRDDDSPPVQLTACSPGGVYPGGWYGTWPNWSNDHQDSFVTIDAAADLDGDGLEENHLIRLPIFGDIGAMESAGLLPLTAADCEFILPAPPASPTNPGTVINPWSYAWSGDSEHVAYLVPNYNSSGGTTSYTIWVRTLPAGPSDPPVDVPIYTGPRVSLYPWSWSHDSAEIAFYTPNTSAWGGTWIIRPDGSGVLKTISNSGTMNYYPSAWSPDSTQLLLYTEKTSIDLSKYQYQLARMPAAGGRLTVLTSDLNGTVSGSGGKWFALP